MPNETFICYSRKDSIFVDTLCDRLKDVGIDPWIDKADIPSASIWKQEILVGIQFCHNFIYVISQDSINSQYCDLELDTALSMNKRIIPIVARVGSYENIRPAISELNWIFFNANFNEGFNSLLGLLDAPIGNTYGDRLDSYITIYDPIGVRMFPLYRNEYRLGRKPEACFSKAGLFLLGDEKVSRHHVTQFRREGRWNIVDGSITFNEKGNPIQYKKSANGVIVKRYKDKKLVSREVLKEMQIRPLIDDDVVELSPDTYYVYQELSPRSRIEAKPDDKETYTGQ